MSYLDTPPDASMLYSLEIPESGGNTWFCGMQAACDALPAELRRKIEGRRIKHDGTFNSGGYLRQGVTPTDDPLAAPGAWHPAILRHPANGRATLYLGRRRNSHVEGYAREESDRLLEALWAHATQPQFVYQHVWKRGDLVMWDNRATMHRRDPFDGAARRIMHRTQIKGSRQPVAFGAAFAA
jgi:taurine dioxygenase